MPESRLSLRESTFFRGAKDDTHRRIVWESPLDLSRQTGCELWGCAIGRQSATSRWHSSGTQNEPISSVFMVLSWHSATSTRVNPTRRGSLVGRLRRKFHFP